jgi:Kef-type K+ transport system membrane component KefB
LPAFALFKSGHDIHGLKEIMISVGEQIGLVAGAFLIFAVLGLIILPDSHKKTELKIPNSMQRDGILSHISHLLYRMRKAPGFYAISSAFFNVRIGVPMTLLLLFGLSWLAHSMGLHPAIGAYLTGLILHVSMYGKGKVDHMTEQQVAVDHEHLSVFFYFAQEWIGPMFFIFLGSQLIADWSKAWMIIVFAIIAGIIISIFQFVTAYYGGRKSAKLAKHDAILLGFGMLPRDVLAFVVLGIAVDSGLVDRGDNFVISIVLTVLVMNIISSIGMLWYRPKYLKADEEYYDNEKNIVVK